MDEFDLDLDFHDYELEDDFEEEEMKTKIETKSFMVWDGYGGMQEVQYSTQAEAEDAAKVRSAALGGKSSTYDVVILQAIGKVKQIVPQMDIIHFT